MMRWKRQVKVVVHAHSPHPPIRVNPTSCLSLTLGEMNDGQQQQCCKKRQEKEGKEAKKSPVYFFLLIVVFLVHLSIRWSFCVWFVRAWFVRAWSVHAHAPALAILTIDNRLVTSATTARLRFSQGAISDSIYFLQETRHLAEELEDHIFAIEQERVHHDAVGFQYFILCRSQKLLRLFLFFLLFYFLYTTWVFIVTYSWNDLRFVPIVDRFWDPLGHTSIHSSIACEFASIYNMIPRHPMHNRDLEPRASPFRLVTNVSLSHKDFKNKAVLQHFLILALHLTTTNPVTSSRSLEVRIQPMDSDMQHFQSHHWWEEGPGLEPQQVIRIHIEAKDLICTMIRMPPRLEFNHHHNVTIRSTQIHLIFTAEMICRWGESARVPL